MCMIVNYILLHMNSAAFVKQITLYNIMGCPMCGAYLKNTYIKT